jgi:mRNA interferase RelE/StbE
VELVTKRSAQKELLKLPAADRARVEARVEAYATDPTGAHHDVVPMMGRVNTYRLRVGDWRVIFEIEDQKMTVTRVAHRREVYT